MENISLVNLQCTFKDKSRDPVSAFALGNLAPAITAWSNDFEFLTFFINKHMDSKMTFFFNYYWRRRRESGASMSLVEAAKKPKKICWLTIGKTGGILYDISDISILVESDVTSLIQEATCQYYIVSASFRSKIKKIKMKLFSKKKPNPYIIAEIGINHNGYLKLAKQLIYGSKSWCKCCKVSWNSKRFSKF